ncbi:RsfA family transcriptional regulator [Desertibacillus haloalkaliphilus]|uniref:RsfA family transcriptional regulator n=1 Tax=Desertibacillus haloalkaliphilus TaxID=1328930 RepID=UPI001C26C58A|nr:RsfA family transcriptional regulator [Desertibacillus haloalkaliphilus]MBU8905525.1 RsfA family transcriptional regulator [Desertibacillus haloalkaliphilus]
MKVRQDAWSHEDDLLLAETVLRHIREGSTQLRAFDEVGDETNRTSAACGFRWNAVVRQQYEEEIKLAKKERKERKRAASYLPYSKPVQTITTEQSRELSLTDVIGYLQHLNRDDNQSDKLKKENEKLLKENLELLTKNKELESELEKTKKDHKVIEEDYQSLIQIMNRARRMAILQEDEPMSPSTFKMDKNGNLEKVAK